MASLKQVLCRYGSALFAVAAAVLVHSALDHLVGHFPPYIISYPVVMLVAVFAGTGPGLAATVLATAEVYVLGAPASHSTSFAAMRDAMGLAVFAGMGVLMSVIAGQYRGARDRAATYRHALAVREAQQEAREQALRESEAQLREALHAAEDAGRAKDQFLAVLSHELRTPLTPVVAAAGMLLDDPELSERCRGDIEMIRRNVESQTRLIDDLLDVTRINCGKVELDRQPVELCEVICRAIDVCRSEISARNLQFEFDAGTASHCLVEADPARLEQVFWNLIRNAVKFTREYGRVSIRSRCVDGRAMVEVSDTGVGIDAAVLPRLFTRFEQGDATVTRRFGGLGLGLAISKGIIELHGGTISAASPGIGHGATFTVEMPLMKAPVPAAVVTEPGNRPAIGGTLSRGPALRILIVEDHVDTARILQRLLRADGHEVETAGDIAAALARVHSDPPSLLISDLGLPDGSGLDLIRQLRDGGFAVPAIAVSGYGQQQDVQRSQAAGFDVHLTKPVDVAGLIRVVRSISHAPAAAATPTAAPASPADTADPAHEPTASQRL